MSVTARSTPNIALIKYWGNRNDELRLPAADSLSMTLNTPSVDVTIDHAEKLKVESVNKELTESELARIEKHIQLMKNYCEFLGAKDVFSNSLSIKIDSAIPPGIGIASSSAVFSAIARAFSGIVETELTEAQVSILARLGSGSACRSIAGGFVAMKNNNSDSMDGASAVQIADENHWPLCDIIIVPSTKEKKVGSTEGHAGAHSSQYFSDRVTDVSRRQQECIDAINEKDFEKLQKVSEEDCLDMHQVMQTQAPPLNYLSNDTHRIIQELKDLRKSSHIPVLYTMDAGPTVHLFCEEDSRGVISGFAHSQEGCKVFETKVGAGAHLL